MVRDVCDKRPCSFCTSSNVCLADLNHSVIADKYLSHFPCVSATVLFSRSHSKPMKMGFEEKGVSLVGSHGMPS